MSKALLIIDLQNDYFPAGSYPLWNTEEVLGNIERAAAPDAPVVKKAFADGFERTELATTLERLGTTVDEMLHQIALHALSTRVDLLPAGDAIPGA